MVTNIYWSQINQFRFVLIIRCGLKIERSFVTYFFGDHYVKQTSFKWGITKSLDDVGYGL